MAVLVGRSWVLSLLVVAIGLGWQGVMVRAQTPEAAPPVVVAAPVEEGPLPDVAELMHEVETNQRKSEAVLKDYLYHEVAVGQENDGHGGVKKTESREFDVFWLQGVQVHKMLKKDGKELTADELKKEDERIDKEVAKAKERRAKSDAAGKETDSHGRAEVTVSRLLTLGSFSNPRRVMLNGRDTIAVDFTGDPKAKTRDRLEEIIRDLMGTVWVDERDRTIARVEGRFTKTFKIGGGLVASVKEGTHFSFEQKKINDEVWLPARLEGEGALRAMLFFSFNGKVLTTTSDYRKFKATATILPGMGKVEQPGADAPPQ